MTYFSIGAVAWVFFGVLAACRFYAHFQREYEPLARGARREDSRDAILFGLGGPASLLVSLMKGRHGFAMPFTDPIKPPQQQTQGET